MPQLLEDLVVQEVSLVDSPANRKKFLIIKREEESAVEREGTGLLPVQEALLIVESLSKSSKLSADAAKSISSLLSKALIEGLTPEVAKQMSIEEAIATLEKILGVLSEEEKEAVQEVVALLSRMKDYGYPKPYGYASRLGYPYPYPKPMTQKESDQADKNVEEALKELLSQDVFKNAVNDAVTAYLNSDAFKQVVAAKVEELLRTEVNKLENLKAEVKKEDLIALLGNDEVRKTLASGVEAALESKEFAESVSEKLGLKGVMQEVASIIKHVDILERNVGISKRLLSETEISSRDDNFWAGVIPFSKKKTSGGE